MKWDLAACFGAGHSTFFSEESGWPGKEANAAAIRCCNRCPIREACLAFAVENRIEHGVWGGMTAKDRLAEKRRLAREARYARRERLNNAG